MFRTILSQARQQTATYRLINIGNHIRHASTMKEAIIKKGPKVDIIDSPIPTAGPGQVVTKLVFSGSNRMCSHCIWLNERKN